MIKEVQGDIFITDCTYKAIPVNLVGVMGKGLALEFKRRYPRFFEIYKEQIDSGELKWRKPSLIQTWIMFPTKNHWRNSSDPVDICHTIIELKQMLLERHPEKGAPLTLALPALGCGLGGMNYKLLKQIVELVFGKDDRFLVELYPPR